MSQNVPASFQTKFQDNLEMQLQLMNNPLEQAVVQQDDAGAEIIKIKDIVGNNEGFEADERHGDTKHSDTTFDGVWVSQTPEVYDADLTDTADKAATMIELDTATTKTIAATVQRRRVARMLQGFYGPIVSGKNHTVSTPFPNGNYIDVDIGAAAATGINVAKLLDADVMLTEAYIDTENAEKWMILTAQDNKRLLTEVPATSEDFKSSYKGEVVKGKLKSLLGWNFIHLELGNPLLTGIPALSTDGSGYRLTPFWVKGGLAANNWWRTRTMVDRLPGKLGSIQIFGGSSVTASRTQPGMSGIIRNQKD